jgi:hypothetical protein
MKLALPILLLLAFEAAAPARLSAKDHGHGRKHHDHDDDRDDDGYRGGHRWHSREYVVLDRYYAPRGLPPGLARRYARTGQLPYGWQKRIQPFPVVIERELPPTGYGCRRGVVGNFGVIYDPRTFFVFDIVVLR